MQILRKDFYPFSPIRGQRLPRYTDRRPWFRRRRPPPDGGFPRPCRRPGSEWAGCPGPLPQPRRTDAQRTIYSISSRWPDTGITRIPPSCPDGAITRSTSRRISSAQPNKASTSTPASKICSPIGSPFPPRTIPSPRTQPARYVRRPAGAVPPLPTRRRYAAYLILCFRGIIGAAPPAKRNPPAAAGGFLLYTVLFFQQMRLVGVFDHAVVADAVGHQAGALGFGSRQDQIEQDPRQNPQADAAELEGRARRSPRRQWPAPA